jgi:hypothetical protein
MNDRLAKLYRVLARRAANPRPTRVPKAVHLPVAPPCAHRGAPTGQTRPCRECARTTDVPLLACAVHGVCSEAKLVKLGDGTPVKCCRICPDRTLRT